MKILLLKKILTKNFNLHKIDIKFRIYMCACNYFRSIWNNNWQISQQKQWMESDTYHSKLAISNFGQQREKVRADCYLPRNIRNDSSTAGCNQNVLCRIAYFGTVKLCHLNFMWTNNLSLSFIHFYSRISQ